MPRKSKYDNVMCKAGAAARATVASSSGEDLKPGEEGRWRGTEKPSSLHDQGLMGRGCNCSPV